MTIEPLDDADDTELSDSVLVMDLLTRDDFLCSPSPFEYTEYDDADDTVRTELAPVLRFL